MPALEIVTNVKPSDPKSFVQEFSKIGAEVLKKPEAVISISYTYNETLSFNGTFDPAFLLKITSLGNLNKQANVEYSKSFFKFLEEKLGVPGNRGYVSFIDPGRENLGFKGTTVDALTA